MRRERYLSAVMAGLLIVASLATPVWADEVDLEWTLVAKPGGTGNIVVSPSEVSEIAIGHNGVIYALDSVNAKLYRSTDSGLSFEDITQYLTNAGATLPATKIVVAQDDAADIAVVTNGGTMVYYSQDGGSSWVATVAISGLSGTIQAIALSAEYNQGGSTVREIAVGTALWGNGTTDGQVWVYSMGIPFPSWQDKSLCVDPLTPGGEVSALSYATRYPLDPALLVIASTSSDTDPAYQDGTYLCLLKRDTMAWNTIAGYPVMIVAAGDGPGVTCVRASLALPSNYSSSDIPSRQVFTSFDRQPDTADDDIYWINDSTASRLNADGGGAVDIASIDYYGTTISGKLLAGDAQAIIDPVTLLPTSNVQVRRSTVSAGVPSAAWQVASVPATGPGNARVAWSNDGSIAYCGTGQEPGVALDESAFSASTDGGGMWRQMGLIDTVIMVSDLAPAPDAKSLFITTSSLSGPEGVWRSAGEPLGRFWERVLTLDTTTNAVILRKSTGYAVDYTMYAAEVGANQIAVTYNRGETWQWCISSPGLITDFRVIDLAVVDRNTLYVALPGGYVSRSTNGALTWLDPANTGLADINMLLVAGDGTVIVGGRGGDVAYSLDAGASFTRAPAIGSGDIQVAVDGNFAHNRTIYAASSDGGIWRWQIGASDGWQRLDGAITGFDSGQGVSGLVFGAEGTLYALSLEAVTASSGGVIRSLNPDVADVALAEHDLVNQALPAGTAFDPTPLFPVTVAYLRLTGDVTQNCLWSVDSTNQLIYRFRDTLCKSGPELQNPGDREVMHTDGSGYISSLLLEWEHMEGVVEYEVAIYGDSAGQEAVWLASSTGNVIIATAGNIPARLESGGSFYWRVRATGPLRSPWSETRSFTSALGGAQWSPMEVSALYSPSAGATDVFVRPSFAWMPADHASGYELVLARDRDFSDVVVSLTGDDALTDAVWVCSQTLDYATAYFWKVRAVSATSRSEWGYGVFTTESAPAVATTPVVVIPTPTSTLMVERPPAETGDDLVIWVAIGIGAVLVVALLVLIVRTR